MTNEIHDVAALARPPLSIDVSPIRRGRSGWAVTDDANAEGYGVYIRNPLAHHIADFMLADWEELSPERLVEAKLARSEEHTSELQSLMRISYAVFCLKKITAQNRKKKPRTRMKAYT